MLFSGLADIYRAVSMPASARDPVAREALDVLAATTEQGLGFFGAQRVDAIDAAVRILQEQGRASSESERLKIVEALKDLDQRRQLRLRVLIQIVVTVLVVLLALAIIFDWIKASDDLRKVAFGLIGTALGYWLK